MTKAIAGRPWHYRNADELYRTAEKNGDFTSNKLHIIRLAPGDGCVMIEWMKTVDIDDSDMVYQIRYNPRGDKQFVQHTTVRENQQEVTITGFSNGVDYELQMVCISSLSKAVVAESPVRFVRTGHVPGHVINYIHPDDYTYGFSGRSPASPSVIKLESGTLVASHDVFWGKEGQNLTKVFHSYDDGVSWHFITDLYPCFWGKLFIHRNNVYMLACSTEYGQLLIGRSDDGGRTWSPPVVLLNGASREEGGPHKAPMPVVHHNGRLWTAIEHGSWDTGGHDAGVISISAEDDLLQADNWVVTPFLQYDSEWPETIKGGEPGYLEGNVVITPDNQLVNLLRYHTIDGTPDYGRAIILAVNQEQPGASLSFERVIDFLGNMSKFNILYDKKTNRYYSLVNTVTSSNVQQRNIVTLVSSVDLEAWHAVQDILDYETNGWYEDNSKAGFQYIDWLFDGDDILFVSRTAINGAFNYHNANYMTFHRIDKFRDLL